MAGIYFISEGSNSEIASASANSINRRMSEIQKGVTPLKIVLIDTSLSTSFNTKTFKSIGGVIKLISVATTTSVPNHTRLKPRPSTSGTKIGTVKRIMDSD